MADNENARYVWDSDGVPYRVELHGLAVEPPIPPAAVWPATPMVADPIGFPGTGLPGAVPPAVPPVAAPVPPAPESPFQALHFYLEGKDTPRYVTAYDIPRDRSIRDFTDEELLAELEEAKLLAAGLGQDESKSDPDISL